MSEESEDAQIKVGDLVMMQGDTAYKVRKTKKKIIPSFAIVLSIQNKEVKKWNSQILAWELVFANVATLSWMEGYLPDLDAKTEGIRDERNNSEIPLYNLKLFIPYLKAYKSRQKKGLYSRR